LAASGHINAGARPGTTTEKQARIKRPEAEVMNLLADNEIVRAFLRRGDRPGNR
jgi:hypothetical protein